MFSIFLTSALLSHCLWSVSFFSPMIPFNSVNSSVLNCCKSSLVIMSNFISAFLSRLKSLKMAWLNARFAVYCYVYQKQCWQGSACHAVYPEYTANPTGDSVGQASRAPPNFGLLSPEKGTDCMMHLSTACKLPLFYNHKLANWIMLTAVSVVLAYKRITVYTDRPLYSPLSIWIYGLPAIYLCRYSDSLLYTYEAMQIFRYVAMWLYHYMHIAYFGAGLSVVFPLYWPTHSSSSLRENNSLPAVFEKGILFCLTRP